MPLIYIYPIFKKILLMTIINACSKYFIQSCTVINFLDFWTCVGNFVSKCFFLDREETSQQTEKMRRIRPLNFPVYIICASFRTI